MIPNEFIAVPAQEEIIAELSAQAPANPFATSSFFESKRQIGYDAWVLGLRDNVGGLKCGCGAFFRRGKLDRALEIPSLPAVDAYSSFWEGVRKFCQRHGVTVVELGTYGSPPDVKVPTLGNHCTMRSRCEFVVSLDGDLPAMLSSNHRRNVKKAQQAGLVVRQTRTADAASAHQALVDQSMDRRRDRGENVPGRSGPALEQVALLRSGAGELFQALRDDTVVSSVLVLCAPKGAYYHSAGTSPVGMKLGASQFLIHSIGCQLSAEGAEIFNLGGADEESGLARFKDGFGALRVRLSAASCYVGPLWRRRTRNMLNVLRSGRDTLRHHLVGRISRMIVYAADTEKILPPAPQVGIAIRALTPEDLQALSVGNSSFHARQLKRLDRFGDSYAYAVFVDEQIAHISWLLPPAAISRDIPRVFKPKADEAEITCCETLPAFRGRGLYGIAIRNLFVVGRKLGVRRIYMKTAPDNSASQSGIEKAGLERVGSAMLISLPLVQRLAVLRQFT